MNQGRQLFRDPENARIAGVCSGIAQYFGIETWLVRILTVTGFFLLAGPFVFVAYIAAWFILDKKSGDGVVSETTSFQSQAGKGWRNPSQGGSNTSQKVEVKTKVWQAGEPPKQAFHDIRTRFDNAERRLRKMETYVTSREFQLNREISRL
ncbi:envelope stress response membrane protein PspC [Alteromonas sp. KUL49]|uniref:envelope stress response membrane protein PspC n=1 Tax=Alteromonas sp. KUL49 TaxID=2480798 RepID=UPI00102F05AA|nr:envelope stress response membrane protein PspC [Alteromonas sp. KUL49]TAP39760.1 envelope stress response membrane protein PspC [Alteromonas sp. KUL49]GEA11759.1 phage shock protein C [Alteromonas sp. KUL49]